MAKNHSFDVEVAAKYKNTDIAILIWHFQYWVTRNKRMGRNFHDGRTWTYQTLVEITSSFPYWTKRQVEKYINKAVQLKILRKGNFNKNAFDRTVWYAFENEKEFLISDDIETEDLRDVSTSISPNGEMENTRRRNGSHQTVTPIPDTLPYTLPHKEPPIPPKKRNAAEAAGKEINSSSKKQMNEEFSPLVKEVAQGMLNSLSSIKKDYLKPNDLNPFFKEVDFILRVDKRDAKKILDVFNWALSDSFWRANMFKKNPAKYLREKFDQLQMKMNSIKEHETPYDKVSKLFKNRELYNNATCYLTPEYIAFERGMKNESLRLDKFFSWDRLITLCESFQIQIKDIK